MPRRPTKDWWNRCILGVNKSSTAIDPRAICGSVWSKKPPQERAAIARAEGANYGNFLTAQGTTLRQEYDYAIDGAARSLASGRNAMARAYREHADVTLKAAGARGEYWAKQILHARRRAMVRA